MDEGDCPCAVQPSSNVTKQMHVFLKTLYSQNTLHCSRLAESYFFWWSGCNAEFEPMCHINFHTTVKRQTAILELSISLYMYKYKEATSFSGSRNESVV